MLGILLAKSNEKLQLALIITLELIGRFWCWFFVSIVCWLSKCTQLTPKLYYSYLKKMEFGWPWKRCQGHKFCINLLAHTLMSKSPIYTRHFHHSNYSETPCTVFMLAKWRADNNFQDHSFARSLKKLNYGIWSITKL